MSLIRNRWLRLLPLVLLLLLLGAADPPDEEIKPGGEDELVILINTRTNRLQVKMNGMIVRSFPIATGRGDLTPEGEFRIVTKVYKPYYLRSKIAGGHPDNPLGTRWLGLSIGNGYKYGIHGTNRPWSIGHSVSSGCIRMRNKDVEYLFRHIPLRTRVIISQE